MASDSKTYIYDPKKVSCIIGGDIVVGFAEGTFINVSFTEDAVNYNAGLPHGSATLNPSREGDISISLIQTSETNSVLQKYATAARRQEGGWYFTFLIVNNSGGEIATADSAWIVREPELSFSKDMSIRTWTIKTGNLVLQHNNDYEVMRT